MKIKNCWLHFKTICKHKWYVFWYCVDAGIVWRGIKHDMSKFNPIEFFDYANNYVKGRSPVSVSIERNGYCKAWMHHKGRNTHHSPYWVDIIKGEPVAMKMPYEDVVEWTCDMMGAGKNYNGKNFKQDTFYNFWMKTKSELILHKDTEKLMDDIARFIKSYGWKFTASVLKSKSFIY